MGAGVPVNLNIQKLDDYQSVEYNDSMLLRVNEWRKIQTVCLSMLIFSVWQTAHDAKDALKICKKCR